MKKIDKFLKPADDALVSCHLVDSALHTIKEDTYDGYLAGFGPAVITAGLIQTIATYVADSNREKVLNAIAAVASIEGKTTGKTLLRHCLEPGNKMKQNIWRTDIIDASIALKMMIRTYKPEIKSHTP